jgi:hypothetical protein
MFNYSFFLKDKKISQLNSMFDIRLDIDNGVSKIIIQDSLGKDSSFHIISYKNEGFSYSEEGEIYLNINIILEESK